METKISARANENATRARIAARLIELLTADGEDVALVGNGAVNMPTLDANGDETAIVIEIKIPKGERQEGGGYSGYDYQEAREAYADKVAADAEKKAAAEAKAKKAKKTDQPEALPGEISV